MEPLSETLPSSKSLKSAILNTALSREDRVLELEGQLNLSTLKQLLNPSSRTLAIVVRNYLPVHQCAAITKTLAKADDAFQNYGFAPELKILKTGLLFGEACIDKGDEAMTKYFDMAPDTERLMAKMLGPHGDPMALLRADLAALWPKGAEVAKMWGRRMLPGSVRALSAGSDIIPHQDDLLSEIPREPSFVPSVELVSNVYLSTPEPGNGGELKVYDSAPSYPANYKDMYNDFSSGKRELISSDIAKDLETTESVTLAPLTGDLILFRGRCIHAVRKVHKGTRASSCVHIGYSGDDEPLRCWI